MKKKYCFAVLLGLISINSLVCQESFKIRFYNVLNYPDQSPASRIDDLEGIISIYQPDIFMVCEINNEQGADNILNMLQGVKPNYLGATFVLNTSDDDSGDQNNLQNMMYYDASKFILVAQTEVPTNLRDFNHYTLKLNTVNQDSNPIVLNVIVCHLKSSSGTTNQQLRLEMVDDLVAYLDTFPNDEFVMLGGDLNIYTNTEPAFLELLDTSNNITFIDPANRIGSWHNNPTYIDVFTQSTRTQTGQGGATGGFDDRFDFILTSENMLTNPDLIYSTNSYKVFGNNSNVNCLNQEIMSTDCSGADYDLSIRTTLFNMSDHLPVFIELETNETILGINDFVFGESFKILGSNIVSDWLTLKFESIQLKSELILIYNTLGQEIGSYNIENLNQIKINVSNWSTGIYYVVDFYNVVKPLKFIKK